MLRLLADYHAESEAGDAMGTYQRPHVEEGDGLRRAIHYARDADLDFTAHGAQIGRHYFVEHPLSEVTGDITEEVGLRQKRADGREVDEAVSRAATLLIRLLVPLFRPTCIPLHGDENFLHTEGVLVRFVGIWIVVLFILDVFHVLDFGFFEFPVPLMLRERGENHADAATALARGCVHMRHSF